MSARIASRSSWGPKYRNGVGNRSVGNLELYLHHSVTSQLSPNASVAQEQAAMRVIERIGQQRFGTGMSYTIVIMPSGRAYWGVSPSRISYHSGGSRNTRGMAICLAGNYEANKITPTVINAVGAVLAEMVRLGYRKNKTITAAHRQFKSTACPGKNAFNAISKMNAAANFDSKPPVKPPTSTKPPGNLTQSVKNALKRMGLSPTIAGIKAYQKVHGLVADGYWGPVTERYYKWVRAFQTYLNKISTVKPKLFIDGYHGQKTRNARRIGSQARNYSPPKEPPKSA